MGFINSDHKKKLYLENVVTLCSQLNKNYNKQQDFFNSQQTKHHKINCSVQF